MKKLFSILTVSLLFFSISAKSSNHFQATEEVSCRIFVEVRLSDTTVPLWDKQQNPVEPDPDANYAVFLSHYADSSWMYWRRAYTGSLNVLDVFTDEHQSALDESFNKKGFVEVGSIDDADYKMHLWFELGDSFVLDKPRIERASIDLGGVGAKPTDYKTYNGGVSRAIGDAIGFFRSAGFSSGKPNSGNSALKASLKDVPACKKLRL